MATANKFASTVKTAGATLKAKATQTAQAASQTVAPKLSATERWQQTMREATDNYMSEIAAPDWKRNAASIVVGLVASCAVYYYGATLLLPVIVSSVLMLTGPGFIVFLISVLGMLALFLASFMAYGYVSNAVATFDYAGVKSTVVGWASKFRRNEVVSAA